MSALSFGLNPVPHVQNQRNIPVLLEKELVRTSLTPRSFSPDYILQVGRVEVLPDQVELGDIPARLGAEDNMADFCAEVFHASCLIL